MDFASGKNLPENLKDYKLVIHCGGCMITNREMLNKMKKVKNITNYGILIAYCNNILDRSTAILKEKVNV